MLALMRRYELSSNNHQSFSKIFCRFFQCSGCIRKFFFSILRFFMFCYILSFQEAKIQTFVRLNLPKIFRQQIFLVVFHNPETLHIHHWTNFHDHFGCFKFNLWKSFKICFFEDCLKLSFPFLTYYPLISKFISWIRYSSLKYGCLNSMVLFLSDFHW